MCQLSCQPGLIACEGTCIDPLVSLEFCGAGPDCATAPGTTCEAGELCNGSGVCQLSCQAGLVQCGDTCVDPDSDEAHCGAASDCTSDPGEVCEQGERCADGVCELACQPGLVSCEGTCVDPDTSLEYCGAGEDCTADPGETCAEGFVCNGNGACRLSCQAGLVDCEGTCINPDTDRAHCGAGMDCDDEPGEACGARELCIDGGCVAIPRCLANELECDDGCRKIASDPDYCGDCLTRCEAPAANTEAFCASATCGVACAAGFYDCNFDLESPSSNGCESMTPCTVTLTFTGAVQTLTVPAGVNFIDVELNGAQGGSVSAGGLNFGGRVTARVPVAAGDVLNIYVGGQPAGTSGGFNGGGSGEGADGRGGGGATDIRRNGTALTDRVLVVGGGGGGSATFFGEAVVGGQGGGASGTAGYRGSYASAPGGDPGTQTGSGNGTCVQLNNPAVAGGLGFGGSALGCGCSGSYGGGGGYYGGGGSGNCRGGAGGSGYAAPNATNVVFTVGGAAAGHGSARITFSP
jgi:hypothetical protein